ncbi:uncharacterized protein [Salminus brasiliensis]|uniref:uncharacterized protein n=1 Tax=Salminus brasiliensis TaxID=930266 RepID=UPI003B835259
MERNLVLPAQPPYQETDVFEAERPQPYLEAKLYIERLEQDNKTCQEEKCMDRSPEPLEGPEPLEHGVSLTMYPIRVPSVHLTCATVQWDMPHTLAEDSSPDSACMDELNSSGGASLDWTVNPLSSDTLALSQEDTIDLIPEEATGQSDSEDELQQAPAVTVENKVNSCQTCDVQDIDENTCVTPLNEDTQELLKDTSQPSEVKVGSELGSFENNSHRVESSVCTEENQQGFESSETLEEEHREKTQDFLTQSEKVLEDACQEKEGMHLYLGNGDEDEGDSVSKGGLCLMVMKDHEVDQNSTCQSSTNNQLKQEPDMMEELDQTHPHSITDTPEPAEPQPDGVCDASLTVETTDEMMPKQEPEISQIVSETTGNSAKSLQAILVATLDMTCDDETLQQLQHAETFPNMQGSAWAEKQGELTCEEHTESSVEIEQVEYTTRLDLSEYELEQSEQSKQWESSVDEEPSKKSEDSSQSESSSKISDISEVPNETQPSEQSNQSEYSSKIPDDSEVSKETQPSEQSNQSECPSEIEPSEDSDVTKETQPSEQSNQSECPSEIEPSEDSDVTKETQPSEQSNQSEYSNEIEPSEDSEVSKETQPSEQSNQSKCSSDANPSDQPVQSEHSNKTEPLPLLDLENLTLTQQADQLDQQETEPQRHIGEKPRNEDKDCVDHSEQSEHMHGSMEQLEGQKLESVTLVVPCENNKVEVVDMEEAKKLAERLYKLENVQRTDVVRHLDKDNEFSRVVGEEYLKFFDFTEQSLDDALRSFLLEVVLIGESQERERVLERFSSRYQQCNPNSFSSPGSVLTLTCAVMLLNTDLHGQNVGKAMSLTDFVSNLDGMNEGENFSKELLKTLYNSIKSHPLEWAVEEKELVKSMILEQDSDQDSSLRSKSNPFQDLAHDKKATVFQKGFLKRKAHADIDGKRTPWGKRSWKTFYAVLKGMVLYLQKDEYRKDWQSSEEVLSVHHALAERAEDYTKRPHVFRLQTADWRVFLFEAASTEQMNSWIGRINLVSALYSSPPFPAAVGSQRKFCRPILPATQSALTLEKQLQSHAAMLQSFQEDLSALQQGVPEGRKAKTRELEDHRHKEEYLQHERYRYEAYVQILEVWQRLGNSSEMAGGTDLTLFDQELWKGMAVEEEDAEEVDGGMKRSHSSPSLELELAPPTVVKVRRNISERRTYRKIVIPRRNREL